MSAPRGQAARHRIVDATCQLLLDGGLDAFTVEAVAEESGSARSTIYRHWPEPRELLIEALVAMATEFPVPDTGSLRDDLESCIDFLRPILDDPRTRRLMLDVTRAAAADPELGRLKQRFVHDRQRPVQVILQRAIARGDVDPNIDPTLAKHLVEGPLMSATVFEETPMTDQTIAAMIDRIIRALQ